MKKMFLLLSITSFGIAFAATDSEIACMQYHKQMKANHQAIDVAYHNNDACTMGKLMIQNRQMFESHPDCFPKMEKMMSKMEKQQQSN